MEVLWQFAWKSIFARVLDGGVADQVSICIKLERTRMILVKLRGGAVHFEIEVGRLKGLARDERLCKECESGEVEDVSHWLLKCWSCEGPLQEATYHRLHADRVVSCIYAENSYNTVCCLY